MGDPNTPAEWGALIAKVLGGVVGAGVGYKALTFWGTKMNLTLAAEQTNSAMREELRKDLEKARALINELDSLLRKSRENEGIALMRENAALRRVATLEGMVDALRAEVASLSAEVDRLAGLLALRTAAPGIEDTAGFSRRIAAERARRTTTEGDMGE